MIATQCMYFRSEWWIFSVHISNAEKNHFPMLTIVGMSVLRASIVDSDTVLSSLYIKEVTLPRSGLNRADAEALLWTWLVVRAMSRVVSERIRCHGIFKKSHHQTKDSYKNLLEVLHSLGQCMGRRSQKWQGVYGWHGSQTTPGQFCFGSRSKI